MCSLKGTTTGQDILDAVVNAMEKRQLSLEKLCAVTTNGAAAKIGHRNGFDSLLKQKLQNERIMSLPLQFHCIIHQEHVCSKTLKMGNVLQVIKESIGSSERFLMKSTLSTKALQRKDDESMLPTAR